MELPPALSICGVQVQPWEWRGSRQAPQHSGWWAAGGLLGANGCNGLVRICRFVYVFFPTGPEVILCKELEMCELQWFPRSHLGWCWPTLGPVQTEVAVFPRLGKCVFRPTQTIFELFKLDYKTQQQLRWNKDCLLSALALRIATSGSQFPAQPGYLSLP